MNPFEGLSSLHPKEEAPAGPSQKQLDLQAYLESNYGSKSVTRKKKKKRAKATSSLRIVDNDLTGFAAVEETIKVKEVDPDGPVVVNPSEAAAFEASQQKKEKGKRGDWHTVEETEEIERSTENVVEEKEAVDLSPPRRTLYDPPVYEAEDDDGMTRHLSGGGREGVHTVMEDLSPPRKPRGMTEDTEDADLSPPRRPVGTDRDLSPARRSSTRAHRKGSEKRKMMDGTSTGVVSSEQMKAESRKKRYQEKERFYGLDDQATGKGAETVYRNRDGRRVTLEELEKEHSKEKKKVKWEKVEWDSGLAQQRDAKRYKAALERERAKPFGRARDDEDLDAMYRARRRWGDPMGHLDKKSKTTATHTELPPVINETNRHWFEKSGFVVPQEIPDHSWIRRGVAALSNRFNIRPGRHWDGVDRSNGFEKEYAKYMNERAAREKEAAQWCMEDM